VDDGQLMGSTVSDLELSVKVSYSVVYIQGNEKRKPELVIPTKRHRPRVPTHEPSRYEYRDGTNEREARRNT